MPIKPRVLVFIVAYNAEKTIASVVGRIPAAVLETYEVEVLIIDDASADRTFEQGHRTSPPFPIHVLVNPVNQGYGGNQKLGYRYAMQNGFDFVALVHGDGQYAPECLPDLLAPLRAGKASAVFGSRMLTPSGALKGGMPLYKFAGNKILTWIENQLLRGNLSEFHSGYRIYAVNALARVPFDRNSNDFHFDTEIIIQFFIARLAIVELPIPTYYGDEICYVNGFKYAYNVVVAALKARLQSIGLFYDRKFDCAPAALERVKPGLDYRNPQSLALEAVRPGSRVLLLGPSDARLTGALRERKGCEMVEAGQRADFVLLLDALDRLPQPENYLEELRRAMALHPETELLLSAANVGFFVTRAMLLSGQFNYGKRGILDLANTRLFTFGSLRRALEQAGFTIAAMEGVPAPYPLALGDNGLSRLLLALNGLLIRLARGLFSYRIVIRARAKPVLETLLRQTEEHSAARRSLLELQAAVGSAEVSVDVQN